MPAEVMNKSIQLPKDARAAPAIWSAFRVRLPASVLSRRFTHIRRANRAGMFIQLAGVVSAMRLRLFWPLPQHRRHRVCAAHCFSAVLGSFGCPCQTWVKSDFFRRLAVAPL